MKSLSDFQRFGFEEAEIAPFLSKHGVDIGTDSEAAYPLANEAFPEWKWIMSLHPYLSLDEAAAALSGIDREQSAWLRENEQAALFRWREVVLRAIRSGQLVAEESAWILDGPEVGSANAWKITPAYLAAWCSAKGVPYPLPVRTVPPQTDASLRDALTSCEQERAQLRVKVTALKAAGDQRASLQSEIDRLRINLRGETERAAALSVERDSLKTDALNGKSKSTLLKIIGGLVSVAYRTNIHSSRIAGVGEMVRDLETVGAGVTEKTLSGLLKEAANVIDPAKEKS